MSIQYIQYTVENIIDNEDGTQTISGNYADDQGNILQSMDYMIPTGFSDYEIYQLLGNIRSACKILYNGSVLGDIINIGDIITSQ